jgi:thiol-disulfide isomerase/thioredoxin
VSHVLVLGPFILSLELLLAFAAVAAAFGAARLAAGAHARDAHATLVRAVALGALVARAMFVLAWRSAYAAHPLQVLDLRDGGWDAPSGVVGACFVAIVACQSRAALRRPMLLAFAAAALVWTPGAIALLAARTGGPALPALNLQALDGTPRDLAAFAGRPTIVNLWATWCPPCRAEMPLLAQAQAAHPELNVVFVDQGEPRELVAGFLASSGLAPANVLLDPARVAGARFDQRAYPMTLFFDAQGRLVETRVGALSAGTLAQKLAAVGVK